MIEFNEFHQTTSPEHLVKEVKKMLTVIGDSKNRRPNHASHNAMCLHVRQIENSLTDEELYKVNLATIREGVNHCRWPREVIERFLFAEA